MEWQSQATPIPSISGAHAHYEEGSSVCGRPWASLGSRPSPYVRVLIAWGWANRRAGKAWDDSSRESRTVVSLVPRPFCGGGKNGLVYTVDACALTSVKCP